MVATAGDGSLRVEAAAPALPARGALYAAGHSVCAGAEGWVGEIRYSNAVIGAVESGLFGYETRTGATTAAPGAVLFGNAGESFLCRHFDKSGNRRAVIAFSDALMAEAADEFGLDNSAFPVAVMPTGPASAALYSAIRRIAESELVLDDAVVELVQAAFGLEARARPAGGRERERLLDVIRYLEDSYAEPQRLDDLAARAALSRFHFVRAFRDMTGASPHQFLIGLRLRAAAERLQTSTQPVTELAFDVGFNDLSHFNRTFRKAFGMSPSRWRASG